MQRDHTIRPSVEHIQQSCRSIQRGWSPSERSRREEVARARQRQLVELLRGWHQGSGA